MLKTLKGLVDQKEFLINANKNFLKFVYFFLFVKFVKEHLATTRKQIYQLYISMVFHKRFFDKMKKQLTFDNNAKSIKERYTVCLRNISHFLCNLRHKKVKQKCFDTVVFFFSKINEPLDLWLCVEKKEKQMRDFIHRMKKFHKNNVALKSNIKRRVEILYKKQRDAFKSNFPERTKAQLEYLENMYFNQKREKHLSEIKLWYKNNIKKVTAKSEKDLGHL